VSIHDASRKENSRGRYAFGDFTLDVDAALLQWRGGQDVLMRPKTFEVLAYLVERHGRLVTKAELIEAVWPDTAVTDNSLAQCLVEIRRALGDNSQQYIRTVARRGYVFAAPVTKSVSAEFPGSFSAVNNEVPPSLPPVKAPVPAGERNAELPADLERIIDRLLEKDREVRYQTAADVRADLKRVVRDSSAGATSAAAASGLQSRRRRIPRNAAIIGVLLLAAGVVGGLLHLPRSNGQSVSSSAEWVQLTNFADSVTEPSVSPDGRMVTFIRGAEGFPPRNAQIFVKLLPDGEAVPLTDDSGSRYGPVFTPDSSRIAYTQFETSGNGPYFDTWIVPVLGGSPSRLLPNAAGLVWLGDRRLLFSEIKGGGVHMGVVTATESRSDEREIYFPDHERGMAHYNYPSPEHKWVVLAEMDGTGNFRSCRIVPFDGSSTGRQVGPPGICKAAAWSPDGTWIYFSAQVQGSSHLWRQRLSGGNPQQITFGPTEETGVAMLPNGRSLVTSVGHRESTVWIHNKAGERPLSSEGLSFNPRFSADGSRVYYLLRESPTSNLTELRLIDLASGKSDRPLPGVSVRDFDISRDELEVAYTERTVTGESEIWLAPLDHGRPPLQVTSAGDEVSFGASDDLIFRGFEETHNFLTRVRKDGTGRARVMDQPILDKQAVSPDGAWALVAAPAAENGSPGVVAIPLDRGEPRVLCGGYCGGHWSPDGRFFYIDTEIGSTPGRTLEYPMAPGQSLPDLPAVTRDNLDQALNMPGVHLVKRTLFTPSRDPMAWAFVKQQFRGNLFQIPLH
jgi:DNA-binding winged helix-turn-helix (wHTH) protein